MMEQDGVVLYLIVIDCNLEFYEQLSAKKSCVNRCGTATSAVLRMLF